MDSLKPPDVDWGHGTSDMQAASVPHARKYTKQVQLAEHPTVPSRTGYISGRAAQSAHHPSLNGLLISNFINSLQPLSLCDSIFAGADLIRGGLRKVGGLGTLMEEVGHDLISQRKTTFGRHHDSGFLPTFSLLSCTFVPLLSI